MASSHDVTTTPPPPAAVPLQERLDFSCAIFSSDGRLVANAPHIPVHLGAMSEAVRYQIQVVQDLQPGDVLGP